MKSVRKLLVAGLILPVACLLALDCPAANAGPGMPAASDSKLSAAKKEGKLYIYASIGKTTGTLLVNEFERLYPGIKVDLIEMDGAEVFNSHMRDLGARSISADLLWSRNVELQAALVKDGYALKYRSPASDSIYPWANMDDSSYATGFEPVAMIYNRNLLASGDYPATHRELLNVSKLQKLKGKIAACDPERNNTAFTLLTHVQREGNFWKMVKEFGEAGMQLYPDYNLLLDKISSGEALFGYNVPAGVAFRRSKTDPAIGYFYPVDYTLAQLQIALITRGATHPNAAMLWIDFILSKNGQQIISGNSDLFPIRGDAAGGEITREKVNLPGGNSLKPVFPSEDISRFNEKGLRRGFLLRWKQLLKLVK